VFIELLPADFSSAISETTLFTSSSSSESISVNLSGFRETIPAALKPDIAYFLAAFR
jgi:hypothetical protein